MLWRLNLAGIKVQYEGGVVEGGSRKYLGTIDKKYVASGPNMTAS